MGLTEQQNYRDDPYRENTVVEIERGSVDDASNSLSMSSSTRRQKRFENMADLFPSQDRHIDPYSAPTPNTFESHSNMKSHLKSFFCSYRAFLLFIPVLLILYIDATVKLQNKEQNVVTIKKETEQFNKTEVESIVKYEEREELLERFNAEGRIEVSPTYTPKCIERRDYWVKRYGHTVEQATLLIIENYPQCLKPEEDKN